MEQTILFKTAYGPKETVFSPQGDNEFPVFELNADGEVVDSGKKTDVNALIQTYKDGVLLENIIRRASMTGESFVAPSDCFGDSRVLPKDLLDAKLHSQRVQSFVDGLSDSDLALLNEKGFDEFLTSKIAAAAAAASAAQSDKNGGDKNE